MADKEKQEKVKVECNDPITAGFLDKKLEGVTAKWNMKLSETKGSTFKGEIKDLPVEFNFDGVTVREALEFACKGQSFRVALQGWLRNQSHQWVKGEGTIKQGLRFILDRKRASGPRDPKEEAKRNVAKMKAAGMSKEEILAALEL